MDAETANRVVQIELMTRRMDQPARACVEWLIQLVKRQAAENASLRELATPVHGHHPEPGEYRLTELGKLAAEHLRREEAEHGE